jgi:predicted nucleic acid-binding protein
MTMPCFLDTNILVYAAYPKDGEQWKQSIALDLMAREAFALSSQVLLEFVNVTTRKRKPGLAVDNVLGWLADLSDVPFVAIDSAMVREAIEIASRYQIVFWNGAILVAAQQIGAKTLYSEDFSHGQRYGDVTVVNPFLITAH